MATKESAVRTHQEESAGGYDAVPRVSKGTKAKRHCGRFWWAYLIVFAIVVLVVVLPVIYVGYPNIARKQVKQARLEVLNQTYANPSPTTVDLELYTVLLSNSSYDPTLYAWQGYLFLDGSDTAFSGFDIPETEGTNGTIASIRQKVSIYDDDQFTQYTITVLQQKDYTLHLKGKGELKLGGLPKTHVDYDKVITQQGMNGLAGLEINDFRLLNATLDNGTNAMGTAFIPNPSTVSLDVGAASFDLHVNGTNIGNATIPNLVVRPGNHSYPIAITNNQTAVGALLLGNPAACGILALEIQGVASVVNGVEIPYLTKALQSSTLHTTLDIAPAVRAAGLGAVISSDCTN